MSDNHFHRNGFEYGPGTCVFHKKIERINWKMLATVDIDRIIRDNDIRVLYDNLKNVAFCDVESELDLRGSDRNLIKLFKLSQLTIDYLLTSQDYLAKELSNAEERCQQTIEETEAIKNKMMSQDRYIVDLKRECHRRKKLIIAQQQIMDSGPKSHHRCPYCEKAFLNAPFLRAHLEKRHSDQKPWHLVTMDEMHMSRSFQRQMSGAGGSGRRGPGGDERIEQILQLLSVERENQQPQQNVGELQWYQQKMRELQDKCEEQQRIIEELRRRRTRRNTPSPSKSPTNKSSNFGNLEDDVDRTNDAVSPRRTMDAQIARRKALDRIKPNVQPRHHQEQHHIHLENPTVPFRRAIPDRADVNRVSWEERGEQPSAKIYNSFRAPELSDSRLGELRVTVRNQLDAHMEDHGIRRETTGINSATYEEKIVLFDQERQQKAHRFSNFEQIRQALKDETIMLAQRQISEKKLSDDVSRPRTRYGNYRSPTRDSSHSRENLSEHDIDKKEKLENDLDRQMQSPDNTSSWKS